jgi:thiol:disulfide interchange protein DsbG
LEDEVSKLLVLPFLLMPVLAFADGSHCAVPPGATFRTVADPAAAYKPPQPIFPAANEPAPALQKLSGTAAPAPVQSTPPGGPQPTTQPRLVGSLGSSVALTQPPALSSSQIQAVPALARIASAGAQIYALGESHGLEAVFARSGSHFQVFYITPDGQAEIGGIMWDASGKDVTLDAVRDIPGVVPTVTIGNTSGQAVTNRVIYQPGAPQQAPSGAGTRAGSSTSAPAVIEALNASIHGSVGPKDAPHLYMLIDPMCSFSIRAMQGLVPYVNAGKIELTVIPLSVLDYEDQGASTTKAEIMVSQPPAEMVADWMQGLPEAAGQGASQLLSSNMALAQALGLKGTPTFVWQGEDGSLNRMDGMPPDIGVMVASIGPAS